MAKNRRVKKSRSRKPPQVPKKAPALKKRGRSLRPFYYAAGAVALLVLIGAALFWPRQHRGLPRELARGAAEGFNVLVITLDTVRADHLGCYGYDEAETPFLDDLAAHGVRFADAVSVCSVTLPSHCSIFTGRYPPAHGARHNAEFRLDEDQETLAEILRGRGYRTAAFVSAFVLDKRFGLNQGFDHYDDNIMVASKSVVDREGNERPAGSVTAAAINWLGSHDRSHPFFAWVHYYDPHNPYLPPPPFNQSYSGRLYDGEIAYMDSEIGKLLEAVERHGCWNNTLIIVVADHGEGLGEHGESTHTMLIYGSTMRVPLIISCPGLFGSSHLVDDVVVGTTDIFPTVLELLGIQDNGRHDGISLLAAVENSGRAIYMETLAPYFDSSWSPLYGLRRHHDKYIQAPRPEYYHLHTDPGELDNLAGQAAGAAGQAVGDLRAELKQLMEHHPSIQSVTASANLLDNETRVRLEALGYVGSISRQEAAIDQLPDPKDMMPVLRILDRANAMLRTGRLAPALAAVKEAEARSPDDRRVLRTKGKIHAFMGKDDEAEEALKAANAIQPHPDACLLLAQLMIKNGRDLEAPPLLAEAARLDPRHGGVEIARGDLLAKQGNTREALEAYNRAIEIDPYRVGDAARARIAGLRGTSSNTRRQ